MVNREEEYNRAKINAERALIKAQNDPTDDNKIEAALCVAIAAKKEDAYLRLCPGTYWHRSSKIRNKQI